MNIRIVSFNIAAGRAHGTIEENLKDIARYISEQNPHVVSLQEVDRNVLRSGRIDEADVLAKATGMNYRFGRSIDLQGGEYGNVILSKLPILITDHTELPGNETRSALKCKIGLSEKSDLDSSFLVVATHFDVNAAPQEASLKKLREWVGNSPHILAGDLNFTPGSKNFQLASESYIDLTSGVGATYPEDGNRYDYIMMANSMNGKLINAQAVETRLSDHYAVTVELKIASYS